MCLTVLTVVVTTAFLAVAVPLTPSFRTNGKAIPIVRRASLVNADNTVDLDALRSHMAFIRAKFRRNLDNFKTNTVDVNAERNDPINGEASLELTGFNKALWCGTITIGTPPTPFTVDIDTGTAEFFVPSVGCDQSCEGHARWNTRTRDSTAEPLGKQFTAKFADGGQATGNLYRDNVTIGGLTADEQTIGAATTYSAQFEKSKFPPDGRMGLAFHTLGRQPRDQTIFETLVSEGKVTNPAFSLSLSAAGGELYLGGSNRELYEGDLVYTKVTNGYWQVQVQYVKGNGRPILRDVKAVIDSGANLIYGRAEQVNALHMRLKGKPAPSKLLGKGVYTFPCDDFPTVSLMFTGTGKSFPITKLNLGRLSEDSPDCVSAIVETDDHFQPPFWILGGVFLQSVYTTFDVGDKRVGFATPSVRDGSSSGSDTETQQSPG